MQAIYDQHDKAFNQVQAFVIMQGTDRIATVALKFPKDGAGRLWCYLHIIGAEMVRAYAGGYGYDKRSAAVDHAVRALKKLPVDDSATYSIEYNKRLNLVIDLLQDQFKMIGGQDWSQCFNQAGFQVYQAV